MSLLSDEPSQQQAQANIHACLSATYAAAERLSLSLGCVPGEDGGANEQLLRLIKCEVGSVGADDISSSVKFMLPLLRKSSEEAALQTALDYLYHMFHYGWFYHGPTWPAFSSFFGLLAPSVASSMSGRIYVGLLPCARLGMGRGACHKAHQLGCFATDERRV